MIEHISSRSGLSCPYRDIVAVLALTLSFLFALATAALTFNGTAIEIELVEAKLRAACGIM
jgi:hypothetical protein